MASSFSPDLFRILSQLLHTKTEDELVQVLFKKIYENLMEEIDAVDNGIDVWSEGTPRYLITTTLSQRVGRYERDGLVGSRERRTNTDTQASKWRWIDKH